MMIQGVDHRQAYGEADVPNNCRAPVPVLVPVILPKLKVLYHTGWGKKPYLSLMRDQP